MGKEPDKNNSASEPLTFEQSLAQLEAVVRVLEDGRIGLDESLLRYEEGVRLLQACRESLQRAERKIMLLTGLDADGDPVVESFGEETASLEEKKEARVRRRSRNSNATPRVDPCEGATERGGEGEGMVDSDRQKGLF